MLFDELKITNDDLLEKVTALINVRMPTFVGFDIVYIANLKMNVSVKLHKHIKSARFNCKFAGQSKLTHHLEILFVCSTTQKTTSPFF